MDKKVCGNCGWSYPVPEGESDEFVRCCYAPPSVFPHPLREAVYPRILGETTDEERREWVKLINRFGVEAWDPRCKKTRPGCHVWREQGKEDVPVWPSAGA